MRHRCRVPSWVQPSWLWCSRPLCRHNQMPLVMALHPQVNPVREKKLSNVRTTAADEKVFLAPPRVMTLEDAIGAVWLLIGFIAALCVVLPHVA